MAGFIRAYEKKPLVTCDFWFFAVVAAAVYFGGDALCLLLAALIHEAGHWAALSATHNGILQLRLRGCCARIVPYYRRLPGLRQELTILAAGPLAGVIFAFLLKPFAPRFAKISLLLSLFNLLPVRGLDGGSVLRLLCAAVFNANSTRVTDTVGGAVAIAALGASLWSFVKHQPNISILGISIFLIFKQFILADDTD